MTFADRAVENEGFGGGRSGYCEEVGSELDVLLVC
jgi:hypothetical protein